MLNLFINNFMENHDSFELIAYMVIPVVIMILNIWLVNKNTNKQIKNQNKETYKPRLKLVSFNYSKRFPERPDYMTDTFSATKNKNYDKSIYAQLELKNIGNGVAHDITFYNLINGMPIVRGQSVDSEINQSCFCTDEIEKGGNETFQFMIAIDRKAKKEFGRTDYCITICNYKDLNGNDYKLLIGFLIKRLGSEGKDDFDCVAKSEEPTFDTYYYQENTNSYNEMIEKNKEAYKKILDNIKKENQRLKKMYKIIRIKDKVIKKIKEKR